MSLKTFTLDTNSQAAVPGSVTAPFGKVIVTGFSDDQPDPDLGEGKVYSNVAPATPNSSASGIAELRLQGALATEISFQYGIRGDQNSGTVGGFTAYGFTETGLAKRPSGPGHVFKQFAVNQGQPIGPVTIKSLPQDQLVNPSGSKYFCGLRWTTSTKANDVLVITRSGKAQIKNITITYEPAEDIYKNPASFPPPTINGASLTVVFDAKGAAGVVALDDLAKAIDPQFTHFNWVQIMSLVTNNNIERLKLKASDFSITTGSFTDPHVDPHPNSAERIAYIKNKGTPQEQGYLVGIEGGEITSPGGQLPDSRDFYFNEGGALPSGRASQQIRVCSSTIARQCRKISSQAGTFSSSERNFTPFRRMARSPRHSALALPGNPMPVSSKVKAFSSPLAVVSKTSNSSVSIELNSNGSGAPDALAKSLRIAGACLRISWNGFVARASRGGASIRSLGEGCVPSNVAQPLTREDVSTSSVLSFIASYSRHYRSKCGTTADPSGFSQSMYHLAMTGKGGKLLKLQAFRDSDGGILTRLLTGGF